MKVEVSESILTKAEGLEEKRRSQTNSEVKLDNDLRGLSTVIR